MIRARTATPTLPVARSVNGRRARYAAGGRRRRCHSPTAPGRHALRRPAGPVPDAAVLAAGRQTPHERPADQHAGRAQRQGPQHVRTATDAAVEKDFTRTRDGRRDLGERVDARDRTVQLSAAVVRHDDRVDSGPDGPQRVLGREDSLEYHRKAGMPAQQLDRRPGQRRGERRAGVGGHRGGTGEPTVSARVPGEVHRAYLLGQGEAVADVAQSPAHPRHVNGQHDGGGARVLGPAHQVQGCGTVAQPVELEPERAADPRNVLHREAAQRADDVGNPGCGGGTGGGQLPFGVNQLLVGHRGDRHRQRRPAGRAVSRWSSRRRRRAVPGGRRQPGPAPTGWRPVSSHCRCRRRRSPRPPVGGSSGRRARCPQATVLPPQTPRCDSRPPLPVRSGYLDIFQDRPRGTRKHCPPIIPGGRRVGITRLRIRHRLDIRPVRTLPGRLMKIAVAAGKPAIY